MEQKARSGSSADEGFAPKCLRFQNRFTYQRCASALEQYPRAGQEKSKACFAYPCAVRPRHFLLLVYLTRGGTLHPLKNRLWLLFAAVTTLCWGVLGGFIELPEKAGFPATLGYSVWALTMVPCSLFALWFVGWKCEHDLRSVLLGFVIGSLGAGGQLLLFEALRTGPAYMVFPIVSLYLFSPCFSRCGA